MMMLKVTEKQSFTLISDSAFCMQQLLCEHFSSEGHSGFLDNVSIIFIDKTDPKDPSKRENYWRHTLKTIAPQDLNEEDD